MKRKELRIHVLRLFKEVEKVRYPLEGDELMGLLESVKHLPASMKDPKTTRYTDPLSGDERCMVFSDELEPPIPLEKSVIGGVFIRRRASDRPFEEDAEGHLLELRLSNEKNQIAEAAFFIFHIEKGILFWIPNPLVGGANTLRDYLTRKLKESSYAGLDTIKLEIQGQQASLVAAHVHYPDAFKDFRDRMKEVFSMEIDLAGGPDEFSQLQLGEGRDEGRGIELMRSLGISSNCTKLTIGMLVDARGRPAKDHGRQSLNKPFLLGLYASVAPALKSNDQNRCYVRGRMVDEETRLLDLLHARLLYSIALEYEGPYLPLLIILQKMQTELFRELAEAVRFSK